MTPIFMLTLSRILRPKLISLYFLTCCIVTIITSLLTQNLVSSSILQGEVVLFNAYFVRLSYIWMLGIPFVIWTAANGINLLTEEKETGTLLLLVSKPIERYKIILSKYLALNLAAILIGECSLLLAVSTLIVMYKPDSIIIFQLVQAVVVQGLYLLILSLCTSAFSLSASIICNNKRKALIIAFILIFLIYIGLPITTQVINMKFPQAGLILYLDISMQLSAVYNYILSLSPGLMLSPNIEINLTDWYDSIFTYLKIPFSRNNLYLLINAKIVSLVWLVLSTVVFTLSLRHFNKSDIMK